MRRRLLVVSLIITVSVLASAAGIWRYAQTRPVLLGEGARIGSVDVSGLPPEAARSVVGSADARDRERTGRVLVAGRTWEYRVSRLGYTTDRLASLDEEIGQVRSMSSLDRAFRTPTGRPHDVTRAVDSSRVASLARRIARRVSRDPVDARIELTTRGPRMIAARDGYRVDAGKLADRIRARILSGRPLGDLTVRREKVRAQIRTRRDLRVAYPAMLVVNKRTFKVHLYRGLRRVKSWPVAIGAPGNETPEGLFSISSKQVDPDWYVPNSPWAGELAGSVVAGGTTENPLKARWMGIVDGVGFHGTAEDDSIGSAASHGCLRMHVADVKDLYDRVPVGAPVLIH